MPLSTHDDDKVQLFSRLLVANQRRLYGFILTLVHDHAAADDILQDMSSLLWQKFDKFEPGTDFAAWGMAVSRLTIFDRRSASCASLLVRAGTHIRSTVTQSRFR